MSASLRWTADGIEAAERAGGITLELYRVPGFAGGTGIRRGTPGQTYAYGIETASGDDPDDADDRR